MENLTEVVFILDRSGSMAGLENDTIGGFNSMLKKQQGNAESKVFVSTILCNHESFVLHDRISIDEVEPLTEKDYCVGGTTALLDALGDAIKHVKNVYRYVRKKNRPQKVLFIITTDGEENSSYKFTYREIKRLIEQQKTKDWEFIFMGANIDAPEVAENIGIDRRRAVNYHADKIGTQKAYRAMNKAIEDCCCCKCVAIDDSWRKELDEDFKKRKK